MVLSRIRRRGKLSLNGLWKKNDEKKNDSQFWLILLSHYNLKTVRDKYNSLLGRFVSYGCSRLITLASMVMNLRKVTWRKKGVNYPSLLSNNFEIIFGLIKWDFKWVGRPMDSAIKLFTAIINSIMYIVECFPLSVTSTLVQYLLTIMESTTLR